MTDSFWERRTTFWHDKEPSAGPAQATDEASFWKDKEPLKVTAGGGGGGGFFGGGGGGGSPQAAAGGGGGSSGAVSRGLNVLSSITLSPGVVSDHGSVLITWDG
jgi:hypothetical protein